MAIEVLGWPPILIWIGIASAITVALLARERMHDYAAEREQRRAQLARALFPYIEAELKKRERRS